MTFLAWPEIESFNNVRKFIRIDPTEWWRGLETLHGTPTVHYKCKVKLHGTNSAVQVHNDGTIVCQSRERVITPGDDNAGFARWVDSNKDHWTVAKGYILYGEWCGPGIQDNVAIAEIPRKIFAVFAARQLADVETNDQLIVEPTNLAILVQGIPDVYVLPWHDKEIDINWKQSDEELTKSTEEISAWVLHVERNDPWVESVFGNKGTGEGLVFYPTSAPHLGWTNYNNLVFKAKGDKHKNIKTAKPAQVNAEVVASVDAFCDLALTEARLEQGASAVAGGKCTYDMQMLGKFIGWIAKDVEKETKDELAASGLTFKQVQKPLTDKAREWYKAKSK